MEVRESVKKLGVIVSVDGDISQVGMYDMSNDSEIIWNGEVINGPKIGAYLTINQNGIRIIASVVSEKIIDQQNTIKSVEFDNRFSKNSINRIVHLKTKGVILNSKFSVTSQYVPMVGNEVSITTIDDLQIIYGIGTATDAISIGKSLLEGQKVPLSINNIFASHIGVFGNTGSGKSNTLHKLYLELFRSDFKDEILKKSQFFVIDFNSEYTSNTSFDIDTGKYKKVFDINTRKEMSHKIPITQKYLFNADILSILFDAKPATQVPFLKNALEKFKEVKSVDEFVNTEIGLLFSIIKGYKSVDGDAVDNWISAAKSMGVDSQLFEGLENFTNKTNYGNLEIRSVNNIYILQDGQITEEGKRELHISEIEEKLREIYGTSSILDQLQYFLQFQKVYVTTWKSSNVQYLNPLFSRIQSSFDSLKKVIEIKDDISIEYKCLNIFSLVHANQEIKRLMPMLISKMFYDEQKKIIAGNSVSQTKHLIIDEAHNILNAQHQNIGDSWQDYRLSVFEEIIKEGRKFGFYLTLASQRPADISPTILSQTHNYFIHRLVNDNDLRMLVNTMPTLDKSSFQKIPTLGKGEVIITGNAIPVPVFLKVDKEKIARPSSDDVVLTKLWIKERTENE